MLAVATAGLAHGQIYVGRDAQGVLKLADTPFSGAQAVWVASEGAATASPAQEAAPQAGQAPALPPLPAPAPRQGKVFQGED